MSDAWLYFYYTGKNFEHSYIIKTLRKELIAVAEQLRFIAQKRIRNNIYLKIYYMESRNSFLNNESRLRKMIKRHYYKIQLKYLIQIRLKVCESMRSLRRNCYFFVTMLK